VKFGFGKLRIALGEGALAILALTSDLARNYGNLIWFSVTLLDISWLAKVK
jgi:hypothetical protein